MVTASKHKILFVLPTNTFGGAERVTYNILSGMTPFETVLLTQEALVPFYSDLGIKMYTFERFGRLNPDMSLKNMVAYTKAIRDLSNIEKPDIIFGVMHFASLFSIMARDLFFVKPKIVASIHGNASAYFKAIGRKPNIKERILITYLLKRTPAFIVPSVGIKNDLFHNFGVKAEKVTVIYNGFDLVYIKKQGSEDIPFKKDCPWIIMVSRLNPQKDFLTLLKAFRLIREQMKVKLFLIGEGELRPTIEKWIAETGFLGEIVLTGFQENPYKYMAKADLFVLSSFFEGLPSVVIEAMALGVPVVASDCPSGPAEIIKNGYNGILIPVGDAHNLASACLSILNDRSLRDRLIAGGRERAEYFSIQRMNKEYDEYFVNLIT